MNPQNSELNQLIQAAIETTEKAITSLDSQLNPINGAFELLTSPIDAAFWSQEATLKALSDHLKENPIKHTSSVPGFLIESLLAFNSAQQFSCSAALTVDFELNRGTKQHRGKTLNSGAIQEALELSMKIELFMRSIKRGFLIRGFPCK